MFDREVSTQVTGFNLNAVRFQVLATPGPTEAFAQVSASGRDPGSTVTEDDGANWINEVPQ
jgi:hypothetical protein